MYDAYFKAVCTCMFSAAPSRRVITAAVIGSLLCALLLVIAIGCTCKLHARRMSQVRKFASIKLPVAARWYMFLCHRCASVAFVRVLLHVVCDVR